MNPPAFLTQNGINLVAVLDCAAFSSEMAATFDQQGIDLYKYRRLVMLGNGGRDFWEALETKIKIENENEGYQPPADLAEHPIDAFSLDLAQRFIQTLETSISNTASLLLYPQTEFLIPLQQLGELACWGTPSPIGNSISPVYGLWFAFRAAFLTTAELPLRQEPAAPSPCDTCRDKPCQSACPVGAVRAIGHFDLTGCVNHRLHPGSTCASRCLARLACPVGVDKRYTDKTVESLYNHSLIGLQRWRNINE